MSKLSGRIAIVAMALSYESPADVSSGNYGFTVPKLYGRIGPWLRLFRAKAVWTYRTVAKALRAKAVRVYQDDCCLDVSDGS